MQIVTQFPTSKPNNWTILLLYQDDRYRMKVVSKCVLTS